MPIWLGQTTVDSNGRATVLLEQENASKIWEVEQITGMLGPNSTAGNISIFHNGTTVAPTSALVPETTPTGQTRLSQTAASLPYLYVYASDQVQISVTGGASGDLLTIRAQYREFDLSDPAMQGR